MSPPPFEHRVRVRYGETDQMGVVYHADYLLYFEEARTAYLAELGLPYAEVERSGVGLAVRKVDLRYRKPAVYGDVLRVRVHIERVRAASIEFSYEILRAGTEELLTTGSTELACLDLTREGRPPRMLPSELRERLPRV